jgi:hypothetical protein
MHMRYKRFLLSFTATALIAAPFALNAEAPPTAADLLIAPAAGHTAVVDGLSVNSVVVKHDTKTALIQIKATNETEARITTEVVASLMQDAWASPMSRMVPPPRELSASNLELSLAPGESVTKSFTVKLPTDVTDALKAAPATAQIQAPNGANAPNATLNVLEMTAPPPTFYASVRSAPLPEPVPVQQQTASK